MQVTEELLSLLQGSDHKEDKAILRVIVIKGEGVQDEEAFIRVQDELELSSLEYVVLIRAYNRLEKLGEV